MLPGFDPSSARDELRAIRVVKPEQRRLAEDVRRPQARRMSRVSFDLDRPAHLALDQHAAGETVDRHRRREEERPARDDFLGRLHVRNDRFGRLIGTARDARQRQRGRRGLQKIATVRPSRAIPPPARETRVPRSPRPASGPRAPRGFSIRRGDASRNRRARAPIRWNAVQALEARVAVSSVAHRTVGQSIDFDVVSLDELAPLLHLLLAR